MTCPTELVNPDLGKSFVGIERYLPTLLVEEIIGTDNLGTGSAKDNHAYTVDLATLEAAKPRLAAAVAGGALVGEFLESLVEWLDDQVQAALAAVAPEAFL